MFVEDTILLVGILLIWSNRLLHVSSAVCPKSWQYTIKVVKSVEQAEFLTEVCRRTFEVPRM